jgi:hypothetical protein
MSIITAASTASHYEVSVVMYAKTRVDGDNQFNPYGVAGVAEYI